MNKIGFKEILDIEESKFELNSEIIYNKHFKEQNIIDEIRFITFEDCIFENCNIDTKFTKCEFVIRYLKYS